MSEEISKDMQDDINRIFELTRQITEAPGKPRTGKPKIEEEEQKKLVVKDKSGYTLDDFIKETGCDPETLAVPEKAVENGNVAAAEQPKSGLGEGVLGRTSSLKRGMTVSLVESPEQEIGVVKKVTQDLHGNTSYYVEHSDKELSEMFQHRWYDEGMLTAVAENVVSQPKVFDLEHLTDDWAGGINAPKIHRRFKAQGDSPGAAEKQAHGDNAKTKVINSGQAKNPAVKESVQNAKGEMVSKEEFLKYMS